MGGSVRVKFFGEFIPESGDAEAIVEIGNKATVLDVLDELETRSLVVFAGRRMIVLLGGTVVRWEDLSSTPVQNGTALSILPMISGG